MQRLRAMHRKFLGVFVLGPSSGTTLPYMDGIRAVAVLFVLGVHTWWITGSPRLAVTVPLVHRTLDFTATTEFMQVGVDLFFVLSGFLLAQPWLRADYQGKPRPDIRRYFTQRAFRIFPAYWVCIALVLILFTPKFIAPSLLFSRAGLFTVGASLTLLQFLLPLTSGTFDLFGHFWTLTIELLFYLSLPWAIVLFLRNRWMKTLPVVVAVTVGWLYLCRGGLGPLVHFDQTRLAPFPQMPSTAFLVNSVNPGHPSEAGVRFFLARQYPAHFTHFALGIVLANIFVRYQLKRDEGRFFRAVTHPLAGMAYFVAGAGLVLFFMNAVSLNTRQFGYSYEKMITEPGATLGYYGNELPFAFGFTLLLAGLIFGGRGLQAVFGFTPLRMVGIFGFSIYLWHFPILVLLSRSAALAPLTTTARFFQLYGAALCMLLIIGAVSYLVVEKPFMLRGRNISARAATAARQPELTGATPPSARAYLD